VGRLGLGSGSGPQAVKRLGLRVCVSASFEIFALTTGGKCPRWGGNCPAGKCPGDLFEGEYPGKMS